MWIVLADVSLASLGDRLPEFKDCLEVFLPASRLETRNAMTDLLF